MIQADCPYPLTKQECVMTDKKHDKRKGDEKPNADDLTPLDADELNALDSGGGGHTDPDKK